MATKEKKDSPARIKRLQDELSSLSALSKKVLGLASNSDTNNRDQEIENIVHDVESIISTDLKEMTNLTGKDVTTFFSKYLRSEVKGNVKGNDFSSIEDIFESDSGGMLNVFQERYRNKNLLYEDLHIIVSQIHELKEAVNVTRDAIVSPDDFTANVSRNIEFTGIADSDADVNNYRSIIEEIEEEHKLLQKTKNHIVVNTLKYGKYYVYTIPYKDIFKRHKQRKMRDGNYDPAMESASIPYKSTLMFDDESIKALMENMSEPQDFVKGKNIGDVTETANELLTAISITNDDTIPIPVLEGDDSIGALMDFKVGEHSRKMEKAAKKATETGKPAPTDGVKDINDADKDDEFDFINEVYVRLIDPRKIIPVKVMDQVIGYYFIHDEPSKKVRSPFTTNFIVDNKMNAKEVETEFMTRLTDKIVRDFDKKFLQENIKFRDTILNAIVYNDIYKKDLKFQFIPAEYITEFQVNEDEDGEGTSIITDSLFYAKLYLALLIFKMITIIARSNDQRIYYVKNTGVDTNTVNKVQDVARQMKQRELNFTDLLNYKSIVSKVGAAKDIFMPVGPDDIKGIDFDIMSGQDVQLNTELMEMLKTSAINSTGVPSVMMNYINEADYAKTLDMGNAKFLNRVASYQVDFNSGLTELYRKLAIYSGRIPVEVASTLIYRLSAPSSLDLTTLNDITSNATAAADFALRVITGENGQQNEVDEYAKDILFRKYVKDRMGTINWTRLEEMYKESLVEAKALQRKKKEYGNEETE